MQQSLDRRHDSILASPPAILIPSEVPPPLHPRRLYTCITLVFALRSITYSVLCGFYGRPVNLISAVKSAMPSFLRLLVTHLVVDLMRSSYLVKWMQIAVLYFWLSFGLLSGVLTWTRFIAAEKLSGRGDWNSWFFVAQIVITLPLLTLLLLYIFAAQIVLYM
ncbi:hypothetical protein LINGRAHAP2_LOCUS24670 [Linum grandiflorum]